VFCIYLRTNIDLCHLQHKLIGFYNRGEKFLLRGTDWVLNKAVCALSLKVNQEFIGFRFRSQPLPLILQLQILIVLVTNRMKTEVQQSYE